ncbi:MAG: tRNA (guanosine(37)-N1)-methyltransferase TrmD [Elusimicrobia bacterium]|nr:tRNA (guanosine(37)-N1)-methyltransferase TrmD [Elusimicrobiota bacterium]
MRIDFVTLFPDMFAPVMDASIMGRAREKGLLSWGCVNPRDFSEDKHRKVDDRPFGGGPGMVMMAEPLAKAVESLKKKGTTTIFMSPQGETFNDRTASRLAKKKHLVLVCGHYEGIDERASELFDEEISIGDYVLTGGELPAMVVADAVARKLPGVLKKEDAAVSESFVAGLLDFPQYTRPREWRGQEVPDVLFSGDHKKIAEWRRKAARTATKRKRPDLLSRA